jgi:hypothetical protein
MKNNANKKKGRGLINKVDLYNLSECELSKYFMDEFDKEYKCKSVKQRTKKKTQTNSALKTRSTLKTKSTPMSKRYTINNTTNIQKVHSRKPLSISIKLDKYSKNNKITTDNSNIKLKPHSPRSVKQDRGVSNKI